jgi:hypothetical protein
MAKFAGKEPGNSDAKFMKVMAVVISSQPKN